MEAWGPPEVRGEELRDPEVRDNAELGIDGRGHSGSS
jgi:hypothetical protein